MTTGNKFFTGLIAGAVIGSVAGLLMAPKPGKETRQVVAYRANELKSKAGRYAVTIREKMRRSDLPGLEESHNGQSESRNQQTDVERST